MLSTPAGTLIFTWGNPSRGDDAIGPKVYELLCRRKLPAVEIQTDFQLQIEHAVDLEQRDRVLFVDADLSIEPPYRLSKIGPEQDSSYTTHAMSPGALLAVYERVNNQPSPASFLLTVRGYEFGLGLPLTKQALRNVTAAIELVVDLVESQDTCTWLDRCVDYPRVL